MAAKRRPTERGPRGRRGPQGKTGPQGPSGLANGDLARLAAQMEDIIRELHTQLTRIAQMQLQIDRIASGAPPQSERRRAKRTH